MCSECVPNQLSRRYVKDACDKPPGSPEPLLNVAEFKGQEASVREGEGGREGEREREREREYPSVDMCVSTRPTHDTDTHHAPPTQTQLSPYTQSHDKNKTPLHSHDKNKTPLSAQVLKSKSPY